MMNNEKGRSMVEMLGVLAIIGVLSVAGIAGYSMAMQKYRANEILNAASQLVVLAQAKNNGNGGTASLSELGYAGGKVVDQSLSADCSGSPCVVSGGSGDAYEAAQKALNSTNLGVGTYYTLS